YRVEGWHGPGQPSSGDNLRRRPGKGRLAGEHLIEHATEAVDVAPAVELLPGRLFWAHIGDCPHGHAGFGEFPTFGRMQCPSDPESATTGCPSSSSMFSGLMSR